MRKFKIMLLFLTILGASQTSIQPSEKQNSHLPPAFTNFIPSSKTTTIALSAVASLGALHIYKRYIAPLFFNVKNIVTEEIAHAGLGAQAIGKQLRVAVSENHFVKKFFWGVITACSQNEQDSGTSTISKEYIEEHLPKNKSWIPIDEGCLSDQYWQDDNNKIKSLGCNMYHFSVDWSRIEPTEGEIDREQLNRYKAQCDDLRAQGITPMICFHHYSDPIWFMEKGGFEKEENIHNFVKFCAITAQHLGSADGTYYLVMSQPLAYINKGYLNGSQPPFKKANLTAKAIFTGKAMEVASIVRKNIFQSHVEVSKAIKKINPKHKIGASHQITPMRSGRYWSIDPIIAKFADNFYNKTFLDFAKKESKFLDFIALSFFSPCRFTLFNVSLFPTKFKLASMHAFWKSEVQGNETDDHGRIIDPQGFYDAVKRIANNVGKEKPIFVIASGVDVKNEEQRKNFLNKTMSAITKTLKAGYNLQGFCVWTLMDNYEWGKGYESSFGLYSRRTSSENMGEIKAGGAYYRDIISAYNLHSIA